MWLVKTVGILVLAIGISLFAGRKNPQFPMILLAVNAAAGLAVVDIIYVINGVIKEIYLLDALIEILILIGWISGHLTKKLQNFY